MAESDSDGDFEALAMPGVQRAALPTTTTSPFEGGRQFPLLSIALVDRAMCGFFVVTGVQPLSRGMVAEDDAQIYEWDASGRARVASQTFVIWGSALAVETPPHRLERLGRQRVLKLTGAMRPYLDLAPGHLGASTVRQDMRNALASKQLDVETCLQSLRAWVLPAGIWRKICSADAGTDFVTPASFMDLTGIRLATKGFQGGRLQHIGACRLLCVCP